MTSSICSLKGAGCEWGPGSPAVAAADGSQVDHTIWRPSWLIGSGPG